MHVHILDAFCKVKRIICIFRHIRVNFVASTTLPHFHLKITFETNCDASKQIEMLLIQVDASQICGYSYFSFLPYNYIYIVLESSKLLIFTKNKLLSWIWKKDIVTLSCLAKWVNNLMLLSDSRKVQKNYTFTWILKLFFMDLKLILVYLTFAIMPNESS